MQTSIHNYPFRSTSRQSIEEVVNTSTHALGLLLSICGLAVLVAFASIYGTASHIVGATIYGSTLVLVYAASTCYHWASSNEGKRSLRSAEQGVIFLFIAGTYTPFTLAVLGGGWGWSLFGVVWGLAIAGIILNWIYFHYSSMSTNLVFLGMGWLCLVAIGPLVASLPFIGLMWLLSGGIAYTLGVICLSINRIPVNHGIWHVLVLVGSTCHYFAVLFYVLPI